MEEELRCPNCKAYFVNPVLLPCGHSLCLTCALALQSLHPGDEPPLGFSAAADFCIAHDSGGSGGSDTTSLCVSEVDTEYCEKVSMLSETDSGVICNGSRPGSFVGTPCSRRSATVSLNCLQSTSSYLVCPACQKCTHFDEVGANSLPRNRALANVVLRYCSWNAASNLSFADPFSQASPQCQLCENQPLPATVFCGECSIYYCQKCLRSCHPLRGPLAKHSLSPIILPSHRTVTSDSDSVINKEVQCPEHHDHTLNVYCLKCKKPVCPICVEDTRHSGHETQSFFAITKAQKVRARFQLKSAKS
ncbi:unnamed protein product [Soboliphyme baturini]|uniref:B box-type domain-containing protein n=1 Tax=Soboliphyme baturini TaxID=241478 RepID=A0A183J2L1_9BILA|nr:unnamed protein product [Soboliphyme baturini]